MHAVHVQHGDAVPSPSSKGRDREGIPGRTSLPTMPARSSGCQEASRAFDVVCNSTGEKSGITPAGWVPIIRRYTSASIRMARSGT